ncbi:hypothetical protein BLA60_05815 [Actinophytocola xinjiangensis]|uniref:Uncharacterized protein n=1 Tax=Actinophytocola xinjiangensis TaxID=485602 RepID=A0A7Z1B0Y4_9PSEU|nr:hypothetical protein [Actinophytocola xinjiangensis]OLF12785.1 hypothetical protein BLA60_05815 [Actinophytocola xinjiangensis]
MGYEVNEEQLGDFGRYLAAEAGTTLPAIETLAREEGMSSDGFKGVLEPLGDVVTGEASVLVGEAFSLMQEKLCDLGDSVIAAAKTYGYVDEGTASLFETSGLSGDNGEDITFGSGNENYAEGGSSSFHVTATDIGEVDRPESSFADDVDAGAVLDVVNWIWSEFNVDGGKSFVDSILEPLAGNPNSIKANGEAWVSVGGNFGLMASNLLDNALTLARDDWGGDAADSFQDFLSSYWEKGAVWAGEKLGEFISKGFEKIAEVSIAIAQLAVDAINKLLKVAAKIAAKFIPYVGWAWTAIEYAAKAVSLIPGVGFDIDALHDNIMEVIDLAQKIFGLYESLEQVVATMQDYFNTAQDLVDTIKSIPEVSNLEDAASTLQTINDNMAALEEQQGTLEENIAAAEESLTELDGVAADAENK